MIGDWMTTLDRSETYPSNTRTKVHADTRTWLFVIKSLHLRNDLYAIPTQKLSVRGCVYLEVPRVFGEEDSKLSGRFAAADEV